MRIEIDQSGRIEDTRVNTVLAFSNEISFSLLILAVDKRECLRKIRGRGETGKALYLKLFTAALFLLVKDFLDRLDSIIIDQQDRQGVKGPPEGDSGLPWGGEAELEGQGKKALGAHQIK
jgi:hypothetical protein